MRLFFFSVSNHVQIILNQNHVILLATEVAQIVVILPQCLMSHFLASDFSKEPIFPKNCRLSYGEIFRLSSRLGTYASTIYLTCFLIRAFNSHPREVRKKREAKSNHLYIHINSYTHSLSNQVWSFPGLVLEETKHFLKHESCFKTAWGDFCQWNRAGTNDGLSPPLPSGASLTYVHLFFYAYSLDNSEIHNLCPMYQVFSVLNASKKSA